MMEPMGERYGVSKLSLENTKAAVVVDAYGGAITGFYLKEDGLNPLSFELPLDEMPSRDATISYKGHFLCLGRWGPPSAGEQAAGVVKHGDFATIRWEALPGHNDGELLMRAVSQVEGLQVKRRILLDKQSPVYFVEEAVTNVNPLGRFYNMVQHPTIAAPFLDSTTRVFCNAGTGFCQSERISPDESCSKWPLGISDGGCSVDLSMSDKPDNNVYSFIMEKGARFGWVVAYTVATRLLIGYIWRRSDFPWVNFWQDWSDGVMRYRGLEFGTTGVHEPLHRIVGTGRSSILGEKAIRYIDAGEEVSTSYGSFLLKLENDLKFVTDVSLSDKEIIIKTDRCDRRIELSNKIGGICL
jgi:hypothetical protein